MAQGIAHSVAWRLRRPELADEIWGEGLMLAVRDHDPRRGFLPGYLKARIRGLARSIIWGRMQSGVGTVLSEYGPMVRDAEEFLLQEFGRTPSEAEVAQYLDIPTATVNEVSRALHASQAAVSDNLEFLLHHAIDISSLDDMLVDDDRVLVSILRQLGEEVRELLYLHYLDKRPTRDIAQATGMAESDVIFKMRWAVSCLRSGLR
ncbi:sigma-70 domain-containing protein [Asanoa sp. WMMD1127]|uniref:sigma-70 family RNA polymerase sigma factor n=1 Tax=Asanoa sp. WMMD1127 TaxID=3016107 RepID=UPI0024177BDB|nr:sigma-70 domain-containing protein [Asanoa sp. WMMD1127]MDG4827501.1 sigma-70 domain-containing protein [Asanoa sp. WMMD1127]